MFAFTGLPDDLEPAENAYNYAKKEEESKMEAKKTAKPEKINQIPLLNPEDFKPADLMTSISDENDKNFNYMNEPDNILGSSVAQMVKKRNAAINYLCLLNSPTAILKSELAHKCLLCLCRCFWYGDTKYLFEAIMAKQCEGILVCLLDHLYENVFTDENISISSEKKPANLSLIDDVIILIQAGTNYSFSFSLSVIEKDGIRVLLQYLQDSQLHEILSGQRPAIDGFRNDDDKANLKSEKKRKKILFGIVQGTIGVLHNMSNTIERTRTSWSNLNATQILTQLVCEKYAKSNLELAFYMTIANVACDDDISSLPNIRLVLKYLTNFVSLFVKSYQEEIARRMPVKLDETQGAQEIIVIDHESTSWHLVEVLVAVYKLAVNDSLKFEIFKEHKIGEYLGVILEKGNEIEKDYGLKLLWQLCFDERVRSEVRVDEKFLTRIQSLKESATGLIRNCDGIQWQLFGTQGKQEKSKKIVQVEEENEGEEEEEEEETKHIMISYNRESRDLCLKIKAELEKLGHRVWIDVESIYGSSIESMANAIENSFVTLMCMTEKYKQSAPCRAEAEYAFQLNKPIIPLHMQKDYKPDGWLGLILGSKIFVHFMKYDFEECIRRLCHEIDSVKADEGKKKKIKKYEDSRIPKPNKTEEKKAELAVEAEEKWTQTDVEKWFGENNLNLKILEQLRPCDGKLLKQLHLMSNNAAEFFYQSLASSSSVKLSLRDMAVFVYELNALFKKKQML